MSLHFSIVIPTYNRPEKLIRAIKSILNQAYVEFTVFIIDDCSSESYVEAVSQWSDRRINYRRLSFNHGVAAARNEAIKEIPSGWIVFLDDDDEIFDGYLCEVSKIISSFSEERRCFIWGGVLQVFYDQLGHKLLERKIPHPKHSDIRLDALKIGLSYGVVIPKVIFTECGLFDPDYRMGEDTEFIIRMLSAKVEPLYVPVFCIRKHEHGDPRLAGDFGLYAKNYIYSSIIKKHWSFFSVDHSLHSAFGYTAACNYYHFGMFLIGNLVRKKMLSSIPVSLSFIKIIALLYLYPKVCQLANIFGWLRVEGLRWVYRGKMKRYIARDNLAIISEDGWAGEHYISLKKSAETPTIKSLIFPKHYIKFIKDVLSNRLAIVDAQEENGDVLIRTPSSMIRYLDTDLNTAISIFNHGVEAIRNARLIIKIDFGKCGYKKCDIDEWNKIAFESSIAFVTIGSPYEKFEIWNKFSVEKYNLDSKRFFHVSNSALIDKFYKV